MNNEEQYVPNETVQSNSRIWCSIRVQGKESKTLDPSKFGVDQTGASIINWIEEQMQSLFEIACSELYLHGDSVENMIAFPPEMTLSKFVMTIDRVMGYNDDQKHDDHGQPMDKAAERKAFKYNEANPLCLVYVHIKELAFCDDDNANSTLHNLMDTLDSKGIEFEETTLYLESRPPVTDSKVDILYNGQKEVIDIQWPKWKNTKCGAIMDMIRDTVEFRKLKASSNK